MLFAIPLGNCHALKEPRTDSLYHLIGTQHDGLWNGKAERLCRFHVDQHLELSRLLNRKISGFRTFENLIHVLGGTLFWLRRRGLAQFSLGAKRGNSSRKIQLIVRDDAGVADNARRIAQEMIVNDKVGILASGITPSSLAIAQLVTQAKMPTVVMVSGASMVRVHDVADTVQAARLYGPPA